MRNMIILVIVIVILTGYSFLSLDTEINTQHASKSDTKNIANNPSEIIKSKNIDLESSSNHIDKEIQQDEDVIDSSILDAITGLATPQRIVSKLLGDYRQKQNPTNAEKLQVLSALSFCANKRSIATVIGEERGKGVSTQAEMQGLHSTHEEYIKYCADLADDSYLTRKNILDSLANQGNSEARSMYFEVGPLGRWPQENEHISLSKEEIDEWINTSIHYLQANSREGDFQAYKTLSAIYGSSPDDPILGRSSDKVKAYTYDYLWGTAIAANPRTTAEVKNSVAAYLQAKGKELNSAQIDQARKNAIRIHSESKPGNQ